jgi:hypothetical protein
MVQMESDHWRVVKEAMSSDGPIDEHTLRSLTILTEQMERTRRSHPLLAAVGFSPFVKELSRRAGGVSVA